MSNRKEASGVWLRCPRIGMGTSTEVLGAHGNDELLWGQDITGLWLLQLLNTWIRKFFNDRPSTARALMSREADIRAVVLESGLETFFYRLGLVLDSLVFGLGLVSDLVIGLAKCSSWSRPSPAIYAFFFSFKTKTRLFRKWVM